MPEAAGERLFVACTPGLEDALVAECRSLGRARVVPGGVEVDGPLGVHRRANLELRTASQVLLRLAEWPQPVADAQLAAVRVDPWRGLGFGLEIVGRGPGAQEVGRRAGRIWRMPPLGSGGALVLRVDRTTCTLSVDSSGELLYRRGYRQEISRAPMRETLAAGVLLHAGYSGTEPLWDPMCGSGTLVIEAAWIAARRHPGALRAFAFESWPWTDAEAWKREKAQRLAAVRRPPSSILGSDLHAGSLGTARRNARRAGATDAIVFHRADATALAAPSGPPGLLVSNLPYGKRIGSPGGVDDLLSRFGRSLPQLAGWRYALLVGEEGDAETLHLSPSQVIPLDNGGLSCWLIMGAI